MEKIYSHLDIIILAFVSVFLVIVLFRLFGKRVGLEKAEIGSIKKPTIIIDIQSKKASTEELNKVKEVVYAEGSVEAKLAKIKSKIDKDFDYKKFIKTSKNIFTKVVTSFAKKDIEKLNKFVEKDLLQKFEEYLANNPTIEPKEIVIEQFLIVDVVDANLVSDDSATITVNFYTRQTRDNEIKEFREKWIFTNHKENNKQTWKLSKIINV